MHACMHACINQRKEEVKSEEKLRKNRGRIIKMGASRKIFF